MNETIKKAAVLFGPDQSIDGLFGRFAMQLVSDGVRVGGIVQKMHSQVQGKLGAIDAIEIDTGKSISIKTPHLQTTEPGTCLLDVSSLAECSNAIHRAIAGDFDLVVIEKFGRQEAKGEGLADEIMATLASDTPAIIALPQNYLDDWNTMTGGEIKILPPTMDAMIAWWA